MLGWCSHHTRRSRTIVHVSMVHATLLNKDKRQTLIIRLQQCTRVSQNSTLTIYRQPKIIIPISSGSPCPCSTAACGSIIFSIYDCCAVRLEDGLSDVCVITIERGGKKNTTCTLVIAFFIKKSLAKTAAIYSKEGGARERQRLNQLKERNEERVHRKKTHMCFGKERHTNPCNKLCHVMVCNRLHHCLQRQPFQRKLFCDYRK